MCAAKEKCPANRSVQALQKILMFKKQGICKGGSDNRQHPRQALPTWLFNSRFQADWR